MTITFANSPDHKPAALAPCTYWFEELETDTGLIAYGSAEIDIDGTGQWYVLSITIGNWNIDFDNCRKRHVGKTKIVYERDKLTGAFSDLFAILRDALVAQDSDEISDECIRAAE